MVVAERHPHAWFGFSTIGDTHLRADRRQIDERRRVAVEQRVDVAGDLEARRAPRAALIERLRLGVGVVADDRRLGVRAAGGARRPRV